MKSFGKYFCLMNGEYYLTEAAIRLSEDEFIELAAEFLSWVNSPKVNFHKRKDLYNQFVTDIYEVFDKYSLDRNLVEIPWNFLDSVRESMDVTNCPYIPKLVGTILDGEIVENSSNADSLESYVTVYRTGVVIFNFRKEIAQTEERKIQYAILYAKEHNINIPDNLPLRSIFYYVNDKARDTFNRLGPSTGEEVEFASCSCGSHVVGEDTCKCGEHYVDNIIVLGTILEGFHWRAIEERAGCY